MEDFEKEIFTRFWPSEYTDYESMMRHSHTLNKQEHCWSIKKNLKNWPVEYKIGQKRRSCGRLSVG